MNTSQLFDDKFTRGLFEDIPSPYAGDLTPLLHHAERLRECFSTKALQVFRDLDTGTIKYWQFMDLPVCEEVPPTAVEYTSHIDKRTYQSESIIGATSLELGSLFGYKETSKHVMYDIYPVRGYEESTSFVSSKKRLAFHTDGSAHPVISPDYVVLYCIRNEPSAVNLIVDLDDLVARISPASLAALKTPSFRHLVSQAPVRHHVKPVLADVDGQLTVTYDEENVTGVDRGADEVLQELNSLLHELAREVPNKTNSLLIMNNKQALHSRTGFTPKFDGFDRWVKGAFVTKSNLPQGTLVGLSCDLVPHNNIS